MKTRTVIRPGQWLRAIVVTLTLYAAALLLVVAAIVAFVAFTR